MKTAMTMTREFFIPKNSTPINRDGINAVCYVYEKDGKFFAAAFGGKRSKPDWHYYYKTEEKRTAAIASFFDCSAAHDATRAQWKEKRDSEKCFTPLDAWQKARSGKNLAPADVAVCLRAVLAREFPDVKFSVRSDRGLRVSWTDGPKASDVEAIAKNYSFEGFDGSIDLRYSISRWLSRDGTMRLAHSEGTAGSRGASDEIIDDPHAPDAVLAKSYSDFVFCNRHISPAIKRELAGKICTMFKIEMPVFSNETEFERFLNTNRVDGNGWHGGEYLSTMVYRATTGEFKVE